VASLGPGRRTQRFARFSLRSSCPMVQRSKDWWNETHRVSASPKNAARFMVALISTLSITAVDHQA
jgi:hypothetical protein